MNRRGKVISNRSPRKTLHDAVGRGVHLHQERHRERIPVGQRRPDEARRHAGQHDARLRQLRPECLAHVDEPRLGRSVAARGRQAPIPGDRRHHRDPARTARHKTFEHGRETVHGAHQVDLDQLSHGCNGEPLAIDRLMGAGVQQDRIDGPQPNFNVSDDARASRLVRDVEWESGNPAFELVRCRNQICQFTLVARAGRNRPALARQPPGNGGPDATARARNPDCPAGRKRLGHPVSRLLCTLATAPGTRRIREAGSCDPVVRRCVSSVSGTVCLLKLRPVFVGDCVSPESRTAKGSGRVCSPIARPGPPFAEPS